MSIFKSIGFKFVLGVVVLGFTVGCSNDDKKPAPEVAPVVTEDPPPAPWSPSLPYDVKAYVSVQTCSGGEILESQVTLDFTSSRFAKELQDAILENKHSYGTNYCNNEATTCSKFASNTEGVHYVGDSYRRSTMRKASFDIDGSVQDLNLTVIPKVPVTNDEGDVQEVLQLDGPVTVNFPNTTCGDAGDVEYLKCNIENPCISAPASHECTFRYTTCDVFDVKCADGYRWVSEDSDEGVLFHNVRCVEINNVPVTETTPEEGTSEVASVETDDAPPATTDTTPEEVVSVVTEDDNVEPEVAPEVVPTETDEVPADVPATTDTTPEVVSVETDDATINTEPDEPSSWRNLPHNVKASVQRQTCSGGRVLNSSLYINFKDAELTTPVTRIYCNDEDTSCLEFASNTEGLSFSKSIYGMGTVGDVIFGIDDVVTDFKVKLITDATATNYQNEAQEVSQVDNYSVTVNFPNNPTCGADSNVECDDNPCVDAPESHLCTFGYTRCEVFSVRCADGYLDSNSATVNPTLLELNGTTFNGKTCVKPVTPIG